MQIGEIWPLVQNRNVSNDWQKIVMVIVRKTSYIVANLERSVHEGLLVNAVKPYITIMLQWLTLRFRKYACVQAIYRPISASDDSKDAESCSTAFGKKQFHTNCLYNFTWERRYVLCTVSFRAEVNRLKIILCIAYSVEQKIRDVVHCKL